MISKPPVTRPAIGSQTHHQASIITEDRRAHTLPPGFIRKTDSWVVPPESCVPSTETALPQVAVGANTYLTHSAPPSRNHARTSGPWDPAQEGTCPRGELSPGRAGLGLGAYTPRLTASAATTQAGSDWGAGLRVPVFLSTWGNVCWTVQTQRLAGARGQRAAVRWQGQRGSLGTGTSKGCISSL